MQGAVEVTVLSFGQGRHQVQIPAGERTVEEALRKTGQAITQGHRLSVNGRKANGSTTVTEGDVVSLMPRVVGG